MKDALTFKMLRKALILSFLVIGLVFVVFSDKTTQPVGAWICCSDCEVPPGSEVSPHDYCTTKCGASSGTCYDQCRVSVAFCWQHCNICDGSECSEDWECASNSCVNGLCQVY